MKKCSIEWCDNKFHAKGFCCLHYSKYKRRLKGIEAPVRHGMTGTLEHQIWVSMKQRCYNEKNKGFKNYGGRGITVCDEWKNSFENFFRDMGEKPKGKSIERINNNEGYNKYNCEWADQYIQTRNQRLRKDNKVGFKGISIRNGRYRVKITCNYKQITIGTFDTLNEAIQKRKDAEQKYW